MDKLEKWRGNYEENMDLLKFVLEESSIEEGEYGLDAKQMVKQLTEDFEVLSAELNQSVKTAEDAGDDRTADMFIAMAQDIEKNNWMLKSYLGEDIK